MGLIMCIAGFETPENITKILHNALIGSDLGFGSCLRSGTSRHSIQCLEGVQERVTKFIMYYSEFDYGERTWTCFPWYSKGDSFELSLFYKCYKGVYDLNAEKYVKFYNSEPGQDYPTIISFTDWNRIRHPICKTEVFRSTFFNLIPFLEPASGFRSSRSFPSLRPK